MCAILYKCKLDIESLRDMHVSIFWYGYLYWAPFSLFIVQSQGKKQPV
jgi:hypothetical protein